MNFYEYMKTDVINVFRTSEQKVPACHSFKIMNAD